MSDYLVTLCRGDWTEPPAHDTWLYKMPRTGTYKQTLDCCGAELRQIIAAHEAGNMSHGMCPKCAGAVKTGNLWKGTE